MQKCKSKISFQYPFVELLTGGIFLGIFLKFSDLLFISPSYLMLLSLYLMIIFSILIVILIYDLKHKIIPDDLVYTFAVLSLASIFLIFLSFNFQYRLSCHFYQDLYFFPHSFCYGFSREANG